MEIDEIEWHDGVYSGHTFNPNYGGISEIILYCELYPEPINTSHRSAFEIKCFGVKRFVCSCGLPELVTNKNAGNINYGYQTNDVLYVFLFGGFIEIQAEHFEAKLR